MKKVLVFSLLLLVVVVGFAVNINAEEGCEYCTIQVQEASIVDGCAGLSEGNCSYGLWEYYPSRYRCEELPTFLCSESMLPFKAEADCQWSNNACAVNYNTVEVVEYNYACM